MQSAIEFFGANGFIPHGYCLTWSSGLFIVVCGTAALTMFRVVPRALLLRSPAQLEVELQEGKRNEEKIRISEAAVMQSRKQKIVEEPAYRDEQRYWAETCKALENSPCVGGHNFNG